MCLWRTRHNQYQKLLIWKSKRKYQDNQQWRLPVFLTVPCNLLYFCLMNFNWASINAENMIDKCPHFSLERRESERKIKTWKMCSGQQQIFFFQMMTCYFLNEFFEDLKDFAQVNTIHNTMAGLNIAAWPKKLWTKISSKTYFFKNMTLELFS